MSHLIKMFDNQVVDLDKISRVGLLYEDFVDPFTTILAFDLIFDINTFSTDGRIINSCSPSLRIIIDEWALNKKELFTKENIEKYNQFKQYFIEYKNSTTIFKTFK